MEEVKIQRYETGCYTKKTYYKNGKFHRETGPAIIYYEYNGKKYREEYYKNGKRHRSDGPAIIE